LCGGQSSKYSRCLNCKIRCKYATFFGQFYVPTPRSKTHPRSSHEPRVNAKDRDDALSNIGETDLPTGHLWQRPGYLIRRLNQIHHALFFECCQEFTITPVQYGLLTTLSERPGLDQTSLCLELGVDRTTMADVLRRLEQRGMVKREASEADGRHKLTYITPKGSRLMKKMYGKMREAQTRLLEPLPAAARIKFVELMTILVEANNQYGRTSVKAFE
jgi:DNA-binding MarR family transcriptional regulator